MRLSSYTACSAAVVAAVFISACHNAPSQTGAGAAPAPDESGRIGDSTAFGVRIVGFNGARDRVTFKLDETAYVVALAVVPGKTVEPVGQQEGPAGLTMPGIHDVMIAVPRGSGGSAPPPPPRAIDQADYQRCISRNVRSRTRPQRTTRQVTDSTGKVTSVETTEMVEDLDAERRAERACSGILTRSNTTGALHTGPNALPQGDRFLVLIASNVQLTQQQLIERLTAMTATATDVQSTIDAIADALYFDRKGFWSGHYMRW